MLVFVVILFFSGAYGYCPEGTSDYFTFINKTGEELRICAFLYEGTYCWGRSLMVRIFADHIYLLQVFDKHYIHSIGSELNQGDARSGYLVSNCIFTAYSDPDYRGVKIYRTKPGAFDFNGIKLHSIQCECR